MRYPTTGTLRVSSRSSVAAMSSTDFTPALTTVIGVFARVVRSADSSNVSVAPRCTPPSPPVANTRIPASAARCDVAATVVAALPPRAWMIGRSRTLALARSSSAMRRTPSSSRPIRGMPSSTAIVAGVTPWSRRIVSNSRAASRLRGRGSPCEMIVDSSATTGAPRSSAAETSSETTNAAMRPSSHRALGARVRKGGSRRAR